MPRNNFKAARKIMGIALKNTIAFVVIIYTSYITFHVTLRITSSLSFPWDLVLPTLACASTLLAGIFTLRMVNNSIFELSSNISIEKKHRKRVEDFINEMSAKSKKNDIDIGSDLNGVIPTGTIINYNLKSNTGVFLGNSKENKNKKWKVVLIHTFPSSLKLGDVKRCSISIAGEFLQEVVTKMLGDIENDLEYEEIEVTQYVSAKASSISGLDIIPLSTEEQEVNFEKGTFWHFEVTPTKKGKLTVLIQVTLRKESTIDGHNALYDAESIEWPITVEVSRGYILRTFIKNRYTWLVGTLIALVGLIIKIFSE